METQDGFIVGIFNYCDRWCERCPLTGRCRVFAEEQRLLFEPGFLPGAGAPPLPRSLGAAAAFDVDHPDESADLRLDQEPTGTREPALTSDGAELLRRVCDLGRRLSGWMAPDSRSRDAAVRDAAEVLRHYGYFIGPKVQRALTGRTHGDEGAQSDAVGSAKAALLAFDRLGEAWLRLAEQGIVSLIEAAPVLAELQQFTTEVDRLFPHARAFVRPGFDEPTEVAMLEWSERD
jgi:hypothetical protein